jgi:hypothetical protein
MSWNAQKISLGGSTPAANTVADRSACVPNDQQQATYSYHGNMWQGKAVSHFRWPECVRVAMRSLRSVILLIFLTASTVALAGDLPDSPPSGWWWYYGQTPAQVASLLSANNARLIDIEVEQASPLLFTIAMVQNTGTYAKEWWWYYGQTEADLANLAKTLNARIVNLDAYEVNGKTYFAAIFISNAGSDEEAWWWYFGQNPADIASLLQQNKARLIDLRQYSANGTTQYAVVMVQNSGANALGWWWYYNVSAAEVSSFLQQNGAYLVSLQVASTSGPTFNVIMNKFPTPGGRGWWWYYGEDAADLTNLYNVNAAWLRDVKTYEVNGQRVFTALMLGTTSPSPGAVTTYHYDNNRTGWNPNETKLTTASVKTNTSNNPNCAKASQSCFGLLSTTLLDEQVDAQPLLVRNQKINGKPGTFDVVYVATEKNSIYAIDASTGTVLLPQLELGAKTLGPAVPFSSLPSGPYSGNGPCNNNSNFVGINSTPLINQLTDTLYVITYNLDPKDGPTYYIHALDLSTLQDKSFSPQKISATVTLANGTGYSFNAAVQRQRPALLEANGNIYAGFGSFCDYDENKSRGWLLGWQASTLKPLAASQLNNREATSSGFCTPYDLPCFLSSIWMSGYGLAADGFYNIFFVTGNSAPNTYGPNNNIQESVVKIPPNLNSVGGIFTPYQPQNLDSSDNDFGSGGVLLLPDQSGPIPHLAVAAGKDGNMYLLNRDNLGGLSTVANPSTNVGPAYQIGGCWCGESYFVAPDGVGRVVSSGGSNVSVWKLESSPHVALSQQAQTALATASFHDPGFFTTVSSNGTQAGSAIVWAVERPRDSTTNYSALYAVDPETGTILFGPVDAGTWPNPDSNPNIVPVAADAKVFVASYKQLAIFGLGATGKVQILSPSGFNQQANFRAIYGTVVQATSTTLTLKLRSGSVVKVDIATAQFKKRTAQAARGQAVGVIGVADQTTGAIRATKTFKVGDSAASWPTDR